MSIGSVLSLNFHVHVPLKNGHINQIDKYFVTRAPPRLESCHLLQFVSVTKQFTQELRIVDKIYQQSLQFMSTLSLKSHILIVCSVLVILRCYSVF